MSLFEQDAAPRTAAACGACTRAASFQSRVEYQAGHEPIHRSANACSRHLAEVVQALHAWARASRLTGGTLTVLAIDPYDLPRLTALGVPDPGFVFYSAPIGQSGGAARQREELRHD